MRWNGSEAQKAAMDADALAHVQLKEALDILSIALPGPRPWPTESVESKLRIYRNMAHDLVSFE